ncbi:hypothetical protein AGMMS50262_03950 [Bacteroidia bacterium]|nr:hypothetical protein AGMMS50262_03950 [Bacteroidia bacterium]
MSIGATIAQVIPSLNSLYDTDGDGKKELIKTTGNKKPVVSYQITDGNVYVLKDTLFKETNLYGSCSILNINNDSKPDFGDEMILTTDGGNYYISKSDVYASSESNGYSVIKDVLPRSWDVNSDGRPDLYSEETGGAELQRYIHYQQPDGSFFKSRIEFLSDEEYLGAMKEHARRNDNGGRMQLFADIPVIGNPVLSNLDKEIDFNHDGLPDLLSDNGVLLNMGNNKFAFAQAPGRIFAKDLNNDGLPDMILYDEDAQTVTSRIYLGNGEVKEQVVLRNFKISDVWCYDFDRDGDVDILIPLNYQPSIGYSYLVFCENQGAGKFKVHENYYERKFQFHHCADVNNDGYYDLVAAELVPIEGSNSNYDIVYCLITGKSNLSFNQPVELFSNETESFSNYDFQQGKLTKAGLLLDLDNDGVVELAIGSSSTYIHKFENITPNHRPNKPAAPTFALNKETGKLKVSWNTGSDTESSAVDLTYSLRIGSAPGKSDVWFPYANADGSRIAFTEGNMGSNLDKTIDVSGWTAGDYYIAIQTVDPQFSGSAFSDEVIYTHEVVTPKFTLSDSRIFTVDTLTISLAGNKITGYNYNWTIPDGQIIEENDYSLKVIFALGGEKTIALQLTGAGGEALPAYEQEITILPNKLVKNGLPNTTYSNLYPILDMDGNGVIDAVTNNGLFYNNGQGVFTKIPKLYNSDLTAGDGAVIDMNMDGLPDIITRTNKGGVLINEGDMAFDILAENITLENQFDNPSTSMEYDFNNDGWMDFISLRNGYFYKNTGDNRTFEKTGMYGIVYDWNNDGLWDLISIVNNVAKSLKLVIYFNKGSFVFEPTEIDLSHLNNIFSDYGWANCIALKDMDNDGYPDLIFRKECRWYVPEGGSTYQSTYNYYVVYGNKENRYENPIEVVSDAGNFITLQDVDNNGFPDMLLEQGWYHPIVYFYPGGEVKYVPDTNRETVYYTRDRSLYNDLNGDNIPDFDADAYHQTKITNTAPQTPANLRARQTDAGLLIEWDAAQDAETPYSQMRYNVSVKKKNVALGNENAFIVSPLNALKDEATVVPLLAYRTATRMEIPMERIPAGSYEIQVQSIDLWNAHSPMSAPFTIETSSQISVQAESNACVNVPVTVMARSSEAINESSLVWDWDGGTVVSGSGVGPYQVKWATAGVKTVKASINGATASTAVMVGQGEFYDLTFSLPATVIAGVDVKFELPEILTTPGVSYHYNTSNSGITVSRRTGSRECKVVFPENGGNSQWIEVEIEGGTCASPAFRQTVIVKSHIVTPKISLVNIDAATGKNRIIWDKNNVNLSSDVTEMLIYKEGSKYNQFYVIGSVAPNTGEFIDLTSNPQITTSRYRIAYNTIYEAQSNQSISHRSTHLMLNRGMGASINLYWTQYEGGIIDSYRIYRGATPETMSLLVEVSGNTNSYTDMTPPNGLFYYAIEYDQTYNPEWTEETVISQSPAMRSAQAAVLVTGRSNAVSVVNAQNITFAQSLNIMALESDISLSPTQSELHLFAEIFPVTADYQIVNWLVVSGAEYAYINQQGVLTAIGNTSAGSVTVRATTIDGSNIYREITIPVAAFNTAIQQPIADKENVLLIQLYPNPVKEELFIKSEIPVEKVIIYDMMGKQMINRNLQNGQSIHVSQLPGGIYFIQVYAGGVCSTHKIIIDK